mgnify:FL=1
MEKESGIALDWYRQYFINSTKHIDYGIDSVFDKDNKAVVRLRRIGYMPMPIDLMVTDKKGNKVLHYIPLSIMYGEKPNEYAGVKRIVDTVWYWTNPVYEVELNIPLSDIKELEIDPSQRMADVDRDNNKATL